MIRQNKDKVGVYLRCSGTKSNVTEQLKLVIDDAANHGVLLPANLKALNYMLAEGLKHYRGITIES